MPSDQRKPRRSGGQATNRERQDSFRIRQERAGLRRVEVWVPDGTQDRVRAFAVSLTKDMQQEKS